jgi:hypothetical protein
MVELLITILVLTLGCLAVVRLHVNALKSAHLADNITAATFLAEAELERLKSLSQATLQTESSSGTITSTGLDRLGRTCTGVGLACSNYIFNRTVSFHPRVPTTLSHQVEVVIDWRDSAGPHSVVHWAALTALAF